jgi:hydroxyethylthiazole kinase
LEHLYRHARTLRETNPLVHCLTNQVVMPTTANVLLAAGASPAMLDAPEDAAAFAKNSSAVLINTGTPHAAKYVASREAIRGAHDADIPWVLDPIGAGAPNAVGDFCSSILAEKPDVISGNASEIVALAGMGDTARGVDATIGVDDALDAALSLADRTGGVVAVTGARDLIVSAGRSTWLTSGVPMLQQIIGTGCSLGALCAAYASLDADRHDAVVTAHAHLGTAAQMAADTAQGPGSFAVTWLDAIAAVTPERMHALTAVEEER